jgi:hypothetical protein
MQLLLKMLEPGEGDSVATCVASEVAALAGLLREPAGISGGMVNVVTATLAASAMSGKMQMPRNVCLVLTLKKPPPALSL